MSDVVLFETIDLKNGKLMAVATLNVEKTLNSLSLEMIDLLSTRLKAWRDDDDIVLVMFQSAGDRAFSAGGDIQNLYQDMVKNKGDICPYCDAFFEAEYRLDYLIHTYPKPTLVWAHGIVMGGGLGVASACDFRIGTERTRIAMPEITIGLIPDAGATWSFSKMEPHLAYFLAWTAANINGKDALEVGLVDYLINFELKQEFMDQLQQQDWSNDVTAILTDLIRDFEAKSTGFPDGNLQAHDALIRNVVGTSLAGEDPVAEFAASLSLFRGDAWIEKAAESFSQGSPTSAHIIYEQFRRAKSMTLKQTFQLELTLAVQCSRHPDFAEGVRALLIDKDNQPSWFHPMMGKVPQDWIEEHFSEPWDQHPMMDLPE